MRTNIAVIIVNWNKCEEVTGLLDQLSAISRPEIDIFVVDNASSDNSVEVIQNRFPAVTIIENKKNLGGTGGFNSGIDHIRKKDYSYAWLLDNDARIKKDTLIELYKVMKRDPSIGMAGSRIVDIKNRHMTVETGANFRWDVTGVVPVHENVINLSDPSSIIGVDYVAVCSALVLLDAVRKVGLMDERLFLFWDDMDWGLSFNEKGFKVVAVQSSVAYHGSFSERDRGSITNYYYGIRNPFLVYTKHTTLLKRASIFYRTIRKLYRRYYFLKMTGSLEKTNELINVAIEDYLQNKWGKFNHNLGDYIEKHSPEYPYGSTFKKSNTDIRRILVYLIGNSLPENQLMLASVRKKYPGATVTVMVNSGRTCYYANYPIFVFGQGKEHSLWYNFKKFWDIKREKFDLMATIKHTPFTAAVKHVEFFNREGKALIRKTLGHGFLFSLGLVLLLAEIKTFLAFPIIMYKSLQYSGPGIKGSVYGGHREY